MSCVNNRIAGTAQDGSGDGAPGMQTSLLHFSFLEVRLELAEYLHGTSSSRTSGGANSKSEKKKTSLEAPSPEVP